MSASKPRDMLFLPELQLQLATHQPAARRQTSDRNALSFDAARYDRWADALRTTLFSEAASAPLRMHWSSQRAAQLNTMWLQRTGAKRSH